MPHGCSVWPAWWTVGPNWPNGGEIDIIEGVHENTHNQYTLHTSSGCTLDRTPPTNLKTPFTSSIVSNGNNDGCAFMDNNSNSYGHGFNMVAGGVFAMLWNTDGISICRCRTLQRNRSTERFQRAFSERERSFGY
jgi:hypothetical protein